MVNWVVEGRLETVPLLYMCSSGSLGAEVFWVCLRLLDFWIGGFANQSWDREGSIYLSMEFSIGFKWI